MLNVLLNGIPVGIEPDDVKDIKERLYYSKELSGYLTEISGSIKFRGDEYHILKELRDSSPCGVVTIEIFQDGEPDIIARAFVSDMVWYPNECACEVSMIDDGFLSRIDNNRTKKCDMNSSKSKDGTVITTTTTNSFVFPNETDTGNYASRHGLFIYDAFDFLVKFMTDGNMSFASDFFDRYTYSFSERPQAYAGICTGLAIRDGSEDYPYISFDEFYTDMVKAYNLAFSVESEVDGGLVLRIEPKSYFKQSQGVVSFDDIGQLEQAIEAHSFVAAVRFGSSQVSGAYDYLQNIRFIGVQDEEYHLAAECTLTNKLDLKFTKMITDTNIIQDVLPSGTSNSEYDEEVFLVAFDNTPKALLTQKPSSGTDYYYNETFTNREIALRWFDQIPESIYLFLGSGNDGMMAALTTQEQYNGTLGLFLDCDDDSVAPNHDVNGNYAVGAASVVGWVSLITGGTTTLTGNGGVYTAPSNNAYSFTVTLNVIGGGILFYNAGYVRTDSSDNFISYTQTPHGQGQFIFGTHTFTTTLYLDAGDKVMFMFPPSSDVTLQAGATFSVGDPLGGAWVTYDSNDNYLLSSNFDFDVSKNDWRDIKQGPYNFIPCSHIDGQFNGWIDEFERDRLTGHSTIKLLSKNG